MDTLSKCELCGKEKNEVSLLIQGKKHKCACNECIIQYHELLQQYSCTIKEEKPNVYQNHTPLEIKCLLDKKMVGQDFAKKMMALAFHDQLHKINDSTIDIKNNVLLIGPTGVGKTYIVELLSTITNIPIVICDATVFSEVGYVGADVDQMIDMLYEKAGGDQFRTERGIIYIDEIDKIGLKGNYHTNNRDVSGEGVQQALLKLIEGKKVSITNSKGKSIIDTSNIMFIFGGAFTSVNYSNELTKELMQYGIIPELAGRIQVIAVMNKLNQQELARVINDVEDSVYSKQKRMFSLDGIDLSITNDAIEYIAKIAYEKDLGARGAISSLTSILNCIRYECLESGKKQCVLDYDSITRVASNNPLNL